MCNLARIWEDKNVSYFFLTLLNMEKKPSRKLENLADFSLGVGRVLCPAVTIAWRSMGANNKNTVRADALSACLLGAAGLTAAIQASAICREAPGPSVSLPLALGTDTDVPLLKGHPATWQPPHIPLLQSQVSFAEIPIIFVMLWKLMEAFSRVGRDRCDTLWDVCHIEVVLLSRPSWMLIQQLTTMEHFCVTCWMNLHVNCRPIALPLKFLEVLHN